MDQPCWNLLSLTADIRSCWQLSDHLCRRNSSDLQTSLLTACPWAAHSFPVWFWLDFFVCWCFWFCLFIFVVIVLLVSFPVSYTCSQTVIVSKLHFWEGSLLSPRISALWYLEFAPLPAQTKLTSLHAWRVTANNCQCQQKVGERNSWPSLVKFSRLKPADIKINFICLSKCYCSVE